MFNNVRGCICFAIASICLILGCTTFYCTGERVKVGDLVNDNGTHTLVFFATWDMESVLDARRVGKLLLGCDSVYIVALDEHRSIVHETMVRNSLDLYYDTLMYYQDRPELYSQILDINENLDGQVTVVFVKDGRVRMTYKKIPDEKD